MTNANSDRLKELSHTIMDNWERRALKEIKAAAFQEKLALRDSLPEFIVHMAEALSETVDRTDARQKSDKEISSYLGKIHGKTRAESYSYTLDQLIAEYHILRQVIFDVMEKEVRLSAAEQEVIICAIEQAVNDAATEFSHIHKDMQERVIHSLAHDLLSPITTAKVSAQMILKRPEDTNSSIDKAGRVIKSMGRLQKMVRDLLDASMLRAGHQLKLEFKECDLEWILGEVANEINFILPDKIIVNSSAPCLGIWNEDGLRRMVENLSINAVKYGDQKAPITLTLTQDQQSATLRVHNEGNPIAAADVKMLFQQFRRSEGKETKILGWGIGLTVVEGMVKAHEGTIHVESEAPIGTTFVIHLPKYPTQK